MKKLKKSMLAAALAAAASAGAVEAVFDCSGLTAGGFGCSGGRGGIQGNSVQLISGSGREALQINFDFKGADSRSNSFLRTHYVTLVNGDPVSATVAYNNPNDEEIPFRLFLTDPSGEVYMTYMSLKPGVHTDTVTVSAGPTWASGDNNKVRDLPLTLGFLMIEQPQTLLTGSVEIEEISFLTNVDADTCMVTQIEGSEYHFVTNTPDISFAVESITADIEADYRVEITWVNEFTGETLYSRNYDISVPAEKFVWQFDGELPFGSYVFACNVFNKDNNKKVASAAKGVRLFAADCSEYENEAERIYEYLYGIVGGCQDSTTPADSEKLGRRWFRFEFPNWNSGEISPGVYDMAAAIDSAESWKARNVRPQTLQTLYGKPDAYDFSHDLPAFANGYGRFFQTMARELNGIINEHEMGNEDNGQSKFAYTEVARHGSAGIRSSQPFAFISTSGTAHIDYNWIDYQSARGIFDTVDAMSVHPYTNNSVCSESASPEGFKTVDQLERLYNLVFRNGGFKEIWNTEVGWPNGEREQELHRANLYVRMLIANDIAGMRYSCVYNWDRDYNTVHYIAGVPLNYFVKRHMGARFVGCPYDAARDVYTAVYEDCGRFFAIQWTTGENTYEPISGKYTDMFGNPVETARISRSIIYIDDIQQDVIDAAVGAQAEKYATRFKGFLKDNPGTFFDFLADTDPGDMATLRQALIDFAGGNGYISKTEQALFSSALDWYLQTARYADDFTPAVTDFEPSALYNAVEALNRDMIDAASVRYLLRQAHRIEGQLAMAENNADYQLRCASELELLQIAAAAFLERGEHVQYACFADLYSEKDGKMVDTLYFVCGYPNVVKFRVNNYSDEDQIATVMPLLNDRWATDTPEITLNVPANDSVWGEMIIIAPAEAAEGDTSISAVVKIDGKPDRITTFNRLEFIPAVAVTALPSDGVNGIGVVVENGENKTLTGELCIYPAGVGGDPLAASRIEIPSGDYAEYVFELSAEDEKRLAAANFAIDTKIFADDGKKLQTNNLDIDYLAAVRMPDDTVADGNMAKWKNALPIKINKNIYTYGSYGTSWSEDDLSAITYLGWNDSNLYFAAEIRDQVIGQPQTGDGMWAMDSVQILLWSGKGEDFKEYTIALSHSGPVVWDQRGGSECAGAQAFISYEYGKFIYDIAIPWAAIGTDFAESLANGNIRYAIALNDDDVLASRRFMERFHDTVVHGRILENFPAINLLDKAPLQMDDSMKNVIFFEDFEDYNEGETPRFAYAHTHHNYGGSSKVSTGTGEHGGNTLLFRNDNPYRDNSYCLVSHEITVVPGQKYRFSARMKGGNIGFGVCTDLWGNQDFSYAAVPGGDDWYTLEHVFSGVAAGRMRVMLRNTNQNSGCYIDSMEVTVVNE